MDQYSFAPERFYVVWNGQSRIGRDAKSPSFGTVMALRGYGKIGLAGRL